MEHCPDNKAGSRQDETSEAVGTVGTPSWWEEVKAYEPELPPMCTPERFEELKKLNGRAAKGNK